MKKMFGKIIAGALAGMLALTTCAPAYAAGGSLTAADIAAAIHALNIREDKALRDSIPHSVSQNQDFFKNAK